MSDAPLNTDQLSFWWLQTLKGDTLAFSKIHSELFNGLYYYAVKLLEDQDLANDAVQELFVKIWTKRSSIGELQKVKPYFFTALRRQILNQLRNLKLRHFKVRIMSQPDIGFSPEEIVIKREEYTELQGKIEQLLNELPKRQKEVIYLRYFEDMDHAQIAAVMGINYQSVLNLAQKALQKLRSANLLSLLLSLYLSCCLIRK